MLNRLYKFCLERLAVLEHELFRESREESDDVLKLKGKRAFRELARAFVFLTVGIKYIFFRFLLALTELAVLVFLSPKEGYELLTHHLGASLPSNLGAKLPSDKSTTHTLLWVKEKPKPPTPSKLREAGKKYI